MTPSSFLISLYSKIRKTQLGFSQYFHLLRRNRQRIRKIPLKSLISEGFWSEWGDSNARSLEPKSSAIPTSLHPDIQFLPLYHGERENQSFFCLWSFMWSKPLLYRFRQSVEIPQTQVSQGFAAFRLTLSRIPPRHSQSKRATNCANPGFLVIQFCTRCGQTCGQVVFLTTLACGGNACIAGVSMDCEDSVFRLEGGATRSQTRRDTNFAIPGYSISAMIPRRRGKTRIFCLWSFYISPILPCRAEKSNM